MPEVAGKLAPVDWVGAGALLVRRPVLEKMAPGPWFWPDETGDGEDITFCLKARAAGFRVYCDGRAQVGHLQTAPVMPGGDF